MKTTRIDIGPVTLSVTEHGEGRPVVLLHGFPEHSGSWRYQLPALAKAGFRAIAPDLRGFRDSDKPKGHAHYTLGTLVDDIRSLLDTLGIEQADLIGHDWGGVIAWSFAEEYPERVRRLVILDAPHPRLFPKQILRSPRQLLRSAYILFFQIPWLAERVITQRRVVAHTFRDWAHRKEAFDDETLDAYVEAINRPGAASATLGYYRAAARGLFGKSFAPKQAKQIRAKTLVIWADDDKALGPELLEGLETLVPDLHLTKIANASHWVQQDQPDHVNKVILGFLEAP